MKCISLEDRIRVFSVHLLAEEDDAITPISEYFQVLSEHFVRHLGMDIPVARLAMDFRSLGRGVERRSGAFYEEIQRLLSVNVVGDQDFDDALGQGRVMYLAQSYKQEGRLFVPEDVLACGSLASTYLHGVWTLVPGRRIRIEYLPSGSPSQR